MNRFIFSLLVTVVILAATVSCHIKPKSAEAVKTNDTLLLLKLGDSITTQVQKVLLANVMQAMKEGGPVNAVSFCNVHAMPLTDSLAEEYNCLIQRVSDKYRNPANIPTITDLEILSRMSTANGMKPLTISEDGLTIYYKPITIAMPSCLSCHGYVGKEIDGKTAEIIRQKYPNDLATGYKEGDLRGLWKITFLGD
jgi:hypothetical protein